MLIMKKDMGGAANVLALAQMVMDAKLKVRLRVLIPAVENAVAGNAFRPLDIFKSRKGPTVEIGNADAEGRLVLADALALADEEKPDLLVDLGTLTGAARVALGPDLPPFYTNDETLAEDVARHAKGGERSVVAHAAVAALQFLAGFEGSRHQQRPVGGFAGSITCALFLQRFVTEAKSWLHVDIYGWTSSAKPARPEGGECKAARAIYKLLSKITMDDPRLTPARRRPRRQISRRQGQSGTLCRRPGGGDRRGASHQCAKRPRPDARLLTQALKGERVTIYDRNGEGFAWGQLDSDGYVG